MAPTQAYQQHRSTEQEVYPTDCPPVFASPLQAAPDDPNATEVPSPKARGGWRWWIVNFILHRLQKAVLAALLGPFAWYIFAGKILLKLYYGVVFVIHLVFRTSNGANLVRARLSGSPAVARGGDGGGSPATAVPPTAGGGGGMRVSRRS
jgi:hypothetical protein